MQLVLATRGSELALAQAQSVAEALRQRGCVCKLEIISTHGDRNPDIPLPAIGGKGLFTKEVDEAILDGRADLAVHSFKDMPLVEEPGIVLAAVPERCSDRDVIVLNTEANGIAGWRQEIAAALVHQNTPEAHVCVLRIINLLVNAGLAVGCGSPRRQAQLKELSGALDLQSLRGNIGTRLQKMAEHNWGGIVTAEAALQRMQLAQQTPYLSLPILPAAGQGALGLRARADQPEVLRLLQGLDHAPSRQRTAAERSFLRTMGGGCHTPAGVRSLILRERLFLQGVFFSSRGYAIRAELEAHPVQAEAIGEQLAHQLLDAEKNGC